jgi:hypothetical protein
LGNQGDSRGIGETTQESGNVTIIPLRCLS